ncbi:MAG: outer membrane protein transport protein [Gemmataceae bacterium]
MRSRSLVYPALLVGALLAGGGLPSRLPAQGIVLPGAGPIHRSMAGASTAAPLDAIGAQYWNPAAMSGLHRSQVDVGSELVYPEIYLGSSLPNGSGRTRSDSGLSAIPSIAMVYQPDGSPWTVGLGLQALAGGSVNFPSDPSNPILAPTGPLGRTVLGQEAATLSVLEIAPSLSYAVLDRLYVGGGPTLVNVGMTSNPPIFGGRNDANGDGLFSFPSATSSRPFWGGGFRAGVYWEATDEVAVGFGFTSPQWFEPFRFNAKDEVGNPLRIGFKFSLPMILSWGVAYRGIDNLLLTADVRYFDYKDTDLFGVKVRDGGLGWQDVFAVAIAGQYQLGERASVRLGYLYNQNPIPDPATLFNIQVPGIVQHSICAGLTLRMNDWIDASLAYVHAFNNSIQGNLLEERRIFTQIDAAADSFILGVTVRYGGSSPVAAADGACASVTR